MSITLTDAAANRIKFLVQKDDSKEGLRVKIVGGGCSGLHYKMELGVASEHDKVFERDGAKVIVDRKSFLYLRGTELDYIEQLTKAEFVFKNPNVTRSCGCGQSFSV